jgi:hypothetical protein
LLLSLFGLDLATQIDKELERDRKLSYDSAGEDMTEKCIRFVQVDYGKLTAKQKELFNFQKIAATLADFGYNCIKLADDWQGADFLAYHKDGTTTLKVQLKSRATIDKKYCGKEIWMAFPHKRHWYLIEHDRLVEKVGQHTDWLSSNSWKQEHGYYSSTSINADLFESLDEDKLGCVYGPLAPENEEPKRRDD